MKRITFKSTPENFRKEYLSLKCNTVRKIDDDIRFIYIREFIYNEINKLCITIENTKSKEKFSRMVTDVTEFDGYYIISWGNSK